MLRLVGRTGFKLAPRATVAAASGHQHHRHTLIHPRFVPSPVRSISTSPKLTQAENPDPEGEEVEDPEEGEEIQHSWEQVHSASPTTTRPPEFKLRPYQQDCIRSILQALYPAREQEDDLQPTGLERDRRVTRVGVSAPTGSGKTATFISLLPHLPSLHHPSYPHTVTGKKILIVVPTVDLVAQTVAVVKALNSGLSVEVEQGKNEASLTSDVIVATYQSLSWNSHRRLAKFNPELFKAVIVDEAHHATSPSYLGILEHFNPLVGRKGFHPTPSPLPSPSPSPSLTGPSTSLEQTTMPKTAPFHLSPPVESEEEEGGEEKPCVPLIGFSATFSRPDGVALGKVFEEVVWSASWEGLVDGGWLAPLSFISVSLSPSASTPDLSLVEISSWTGDFLERSLGDLLNTDAMNEEVVDGWEKVAQTRPTTLVFCINIAHVVGLTNTFRRRGIDARCIYTGSTVNNSEREELLDDFRRGKFPVLVNCGILTEGIDIPTLTCILLCRPTRSQNLFLQMLGRGMRLSPQTGKTDCLVVDFAMRGNGLEVVSLPSLFGLDPGALEKDKVHSHDSLVKLVSEQPPPAPSAGNGISASYGSLSDIFEYASTLRGGAAPEGEGERGVPVAKMSRNAWVACGGGTYVLVMGWGKMAKIDRIERNGESLYQSRFAYPVPPHNATYYDPIAVHPSLRSLLAATDKYIEQTLIDEAQFSLARNALWRRSETTEAQRNKILGMLCRGKNPLQPDGEAKESESSEGAIDQFWIGRPPGKMIRIGDLTRGQASDILARLKNGGIKFRREMLKTEKREEKERLKMEKLSRKLKGAEVFRPGGK
ncbi:P-loop containing nucleoside triphosphate hydrolase protein [Meredithblackwellia eburnea MCA 4105]